MHVLVDRFILRAAEEHATKRSRVVQQRLARMCRAADVRLAAADEIDPWSTAIGIDLQRDAVALLARAALIDSGAGADAKLDEIWAEIEAPAAVRDLVGSQDVTSADALSADAQLDMRLALSEIAARLRARVEPRTATEIRQARRARVASALVCAAAVLVFGLRAIFGRTNYTRGARVTASSQFPGFGPQPDGVINGEIESKFGVHTYYDPSPWVMIALTKQRTIREIRVYPRGDGGLDETWPIDLEISNDGEHWEMLEERVTPFSQADPWVIHTERTARFVRASKRSFGYIALAEIEVY